MCARKNAKKICQSVDAAASAYRVRPEIATGVENLLTQPAVQQGIAFLKADHALTLQEQKAITEIPAPPFQESERSAYYLQRLRELGLVDAKVDDVGNVYGRHRGAGSGPTVLIAAHLDTVFPAGTDVSVKEKDGRLYAPGISDNGRGLAEVLSILRAVKESGVKTIGDIIFGGDVGEEGLGDLRGMKAFFRENTNIDGFIAIDGAKAGNVAYLATGSRRYEVTYQGPGGHSFGAFGLPSAIHALGRAIAKIADLIVPADPKTTFTVGEIKGGTSVNAIAAQASMLIDMRSNDTKALKNLEAEVLQCIQTAAAEENARWNSEVIKAELKLVGDRPAGQQPADAVMVQTAWAATSALGEKPALAAAGSTDANLPISYGIPAITVGRGGCSGSGHTTEEWFDPQNAYLGPQITFLTLLALVGVVDVVDPVLLKA
jgi:tripeptide aminopeptidase